MGKISKLYVIGSLRNPEVPKIAQAIRAECFIEVFDDWYAAGPEADDYWRDYEKAKGHSYEEALKGYAARHVFGFDKHHLDTADAALLVLPAGKSGHLELGYVAGQGKPTFILLDETPKLAENWYWVAGVFEGEGSLTRNGKKNAHGLQLTVTMRDEDIIRRLREETGKGSVEGPYKRDNPKWSDMWRWAVRRREDVLYCVRGLWPLLGKRRREQVAAVLGDAGIPIEEVFKLEHKKCPQEFRFDVMYQFASVVTPCLDEIVNTIKKKNV